MSTIQRQVANGPVRTVLSVVLSALVPGLGSALNGNYYWAPIIFGGTLLAWVAAFFFIGIPFLIMFYVWALYDAYRSSYELGLRYRMA